jgi:hypothetical protein
MPSCRNWSTMPVSDVKVFFFNEYTLDLRRGCLCRGDREIELRPKSFALLRNPAEIEAATKGR